MPHHVVLADSPNSTNFPGEEPLNATNAALSGRLGGRILAEAHNLKN
jgi:hypothetical protein